MNSEEITDAHWPHSFLICLIVSFQVFAVSGAEPAADPEV